MKRNRNRDMNFFGMSFMDVLANAVGGLAFLLVLAVMMVGIAASFLPPKINTEKLPNAFENQEYAVWLAAKEGMGQYRWSIGDGELPAGLTLDEKTGQLSGTVKLAPEADARNTYQFELICESAVENSAEVEDDRRNFELTVVRSAPATVLPLRIMTEDLPDAYGSQPYPLCLAAEGGLAPYEWKLLGTLPRGILVQSDGRFVGTPEETGQFKLRIGVRSSDGQKQIKDYLLTVSEKFPPPPPTPKLRVVAKDIPAAVSQKSYTIYPAAEGGVPPYSWSIVGNKPAWLAIAPGAVAFTGTPTISDVGRVEFIVQVEDSSGTKAKSPEAVVLEVLRPEAPDYKPLVMRSEELPEARVGENYQLALRADGGTPPYHWSVSPAMPDIGIKFTEEGVFVGNPKSPASAELKFSVTDSGAVVSSAEKTMNFRVRPGPLPVQILSTNALEGRVGEAYELAFSATGGHPPYHWKLLEGTLPPGLTFEPDTGRIVGEPSEPGSWKLRVAVEDGEKLAAKEDLSFDLTILTSLGFTKLIAKSDAIPDLLKDNEVSLAMACEGGRAPYHWEFINHQPPGLEFSGSVLGGQPTVTGEFPSTLRAHDSSGQSVDVAIPIQVRSMIPAMWFYLLVAAFCLAILSLLLLLRSFFALKPLPLEINMEAIPNARASCDYSVQLSCIGGIPPYRWSTIKGELPPGLTLSEQGLLSGCPLEGIGVNEPQEFAFTVQVQDSQGGKAEKPI